MELCPPPAKQNRYQLPSGHNAISPIILTGDIQHQHIHKKVFSCILKYTVEFISVDLVFAGITIHMYNFLFFLNHIIYSGNNHNYNSEHVNDFY